MKIAVFVLAIVAVIAVVSVVIKLISGAAAIVTGAPNTILALAVIAALIVIVVWMFSYAKKMKK